VPEVQEQQRQAAEVGEREQVESAHGRDAMRIAAVGFARCTAQQAVEEQRRMTACASPAAEGGRVHARVRPPRPATREH
jgi:hypothetical protein